MLTGSLDGSTNLNNLFKSEQKKDILRIPDTAGKGHLELGEVAADISPQDKVSTFSILAPLLAAKLVRISRRRERQDKGGGMWTVPGSMASPPSKV